MHFKGISEQDTTDIRVGLFLEDQGTSSRLAPLLESGGMTVGPVVGTRGSDNFLRKLTPSDFCGLRAAIVDVGGQPDPAALVREVHQRCAGSLKIVAMGVKNDIEFYRYIRAAGASEYYAHPVPSDELVQALRRLLMLEQGCPGSSVRSGRMVTVYGTQGGSGTGTFSAGLSVLLSQKHGRNTILVDTDFSCPTAGSNLGCDQPGNFSMLLEEVNRLDRVLVSQVVQTPMGHLALLDAYEGLGARRATSAEAAQPLIHLLADEYRYQVWRVSGTHSPLSVPALAQSDVVVLVVNGTLPAARAAQSSLRWLAEHNPSARVIPVYNRPGPHAVVPPQTLEDIIERKIPYVIPYQRGLGNAMLQGVPANSAKHCLNRYFTRISNDILGISTAERPWWPWSHAGGGH